jgi:hypothetical protein
MMATASVPYVAQLGELAVEVPFQQFNYDRIPNVWIDGGPPAFQFDIRSAAGKSPLSSASTATGDLSWLLEEQDPTRLVLHYLTLKGSMEDQSARLAFSSPVLPAVSCTSTLNGTSLMAITADGTLHTVLLPTSAQQPDPLPTRLQTGAVSSAPLAGLFHRAGAPSCLMQIADTVCIGTQQGALLCLPAGNLVPEAATVLKPSTLLGFTKVRRGSGGRGSHPGAPQAWRRPGAPRRFRRCLACLAGPAKAKRYSCCRSCTSTTRTSSAPCTPARRSGERAPGLAAAALDGPTRPMPPTSLARAWLCSWHVGCGKGRHRNWSIALTCSRMETAAG